MSDLTDKIRKLIAKAQGTTNSTEAALFMNKATELMTANGLTMEAVDVASIKEGRVRSQFSVSKAKDYEITLMTSIAHSFGCELLWQASRSWMKYSASKNNYAEIILVGPKDRLDLALYAAEVLGRQLFKARSEYSAERSKIYWQAAADAGDFSSIQACKDDDKADAWNGGKGQLAQMIGPRVTREANSFAIGWVVEIRKKVSKFALNDREQVLIASYIDGKVAKDEDGNAKTCDMNKTAAEAGSFYAGQAAAKDAHLHRPVGSSAQEMNLLGQTLQLK